MMGRGDGPGAGAAGGPTRHVPVLVVTVHVFPQDRKRAAEVGSTDFMPKPLDPSSLLVRVESLIGPARRAGGP